MEINKEMTGSIKISNNIVVEIVNVSKNDIPKYETPNSAGMDIRADFSRITPDKPIKLFGDGEIIFKNDVIKTTMLRLDPGARALIPTGLFVAIPEGHEIQIRPRSGLSLNKGISVLNSPGTIDADYRHEIGIILINQGLEAVWIEDGERVAQMVIARVSSVDFDVKSSVKELGTTERLGGFGHTGTK